MTDLEKIELALRHVAAIGPSHLLRDVANELMSMSKAVSSEWEEDARYYLEDLRND